MSIKNLADQAENPERSTGGGAFPFLEAVAKPFFEHQKI
jgi:hypothetical protein